MLWGRYWNAPVKRRLRAELAQDDFVLTGPEA